MLRFQVQGLSALAANFRAAEAEIQRGALAAGRRYGERTRDEARSRARVDTGKMRDTIEDRYSDGGYVVSVGWDVPKFTADGDAFRPIFHELGTSKMPAKPMIGPAHEIYAPVYTREVGSMLRKAVERRR